MNIKEYKTKFGKEYCSNCDFSIPLVKYIDHFRCSCCGYIYLFKEKNSSNKKKKRENPESFPLNYTLDAFNVEV